MMTFPRVLTAAALGWCPVAAQTPPPEVVARCEVIADARGRVFELRRASPGDGRWALAMTERKGEGGEVLLPLPDAQPVLGERIRLSFRTLNGGRHVELEIGPGGASLEIDVNYELEVNVERDLDPRVERMNTGGPLTALRCTRARVGDWPEAGVIGESLPVASSTGGTAATSPAPPCTARLSRQSSGDPCPRAR